MKKVILIVPALIVSLSFFGQTLARFGNQTISRSEFLTAFRKNNNHVRATDAVYRDYLNLYIRYRLKVQAAVDQHLDTLAAQKTDLQNFRSQVIDSYTNDETSLNEMAREAFTRSLTDIRVSYIFVAVPKNATPADTAKAWQKIQEANRRLKSNADFGETAVLYSEDPFVKSNKGDIGYVTAFDLPYPMETVAYRTPKGGYSPVFRTTGGYMILKKTAERPAEGRIRIAQILLTFPYQANDSAKEDTRRRADSLYQAIRLGSDFAALARKFSGDNLSYQMGGVLPEFGIGKYEAGFEHAAFDLKKDGDVSAPYASSFGYHIIKRISKKPIPKTADPKTLEELKEKIKGDPRVVYSRKRMLQTILKQTGFHQYIPADQKLWDYTDSLLLGKRPPENGGVRDQTPLFQFSDKKYTAGDWIVYRKSLSSVPSLTSGKSNNDLLDLYRQTVAFDYYKDHLEKYNPEFAAQVREFRDGNLLFEIMQRRIWTRASADSAGLRAFFDANSKAYAWKPGAEAIIFNSPDPGTAEKLKTVLKNNPEQWRKAVEGFAGQVQADSGRFESQQIPSFNSAERSGFTNLATNSDKSVRFAYIIRRYNSSAPRTFDEARGLAINAYQNELEDEWIAELKKKYPVSVNEPVFKTLPR